MGTAGIFSCPVWERDYFRSLPQPAGHCGKGSDLGPYGGGSGRFYGFPPVYLPYGGKTAAAVVWIKGIYPKAERLIDIILKKTGWVLTGILLVFMAFNILVSVLALVRYDTRADGKAAVYKWEQAMDKYFDDVKMERIYPNAIRQKMSRGKGQG